MTKWLTFTFPDFSLADLQNSMSRKLPLSTEVNATMYMQTATVKYIHMQVQVHSYVHLPLTLLDSTLFSLCLSMILGVY